MRRLPAPLRELLDAYDPQVRRLFRASRDRVLEAAPEANELVYDAYNAVAAAYSFSERLKDGFCHVAAYTSHVNLGFHRGAELPDPEGLLEGSGVRIRHVKIRALADLDRPGVRTLVAAAARGGRSRVASSPRGPSLQVRHTRGRKRRPWRRADAAA